MQNEQDRHLFMRCNAIDISPFGELPEGYHLRTCRPEELDIWYGFPFDTPEDAEKYRSFMQTYFQEVYAGQEERFFAACLFVCDAQDVPVATGFLWKRDGHTTVEWIKTKLHAEGQGIGRALLTAILRQASAQDMPIYLHTHAGCNRAVHLYTQFGFEVLTQPMIIADRPNEWQQALEYLRQVMPEEMYRQLRFTKYE